MLHNKYFPLHAQPVGPKEAIERARNLVSHPEMLYDGLEGRRIMAGLLDALAKWPTVLKAIEEGAEIFPLASWDTAAPHGIMRWAEEAEILGARPEKVAEARGIATHWDTRGERRNPT